MNLVDLIFNNDILEPETLDKLFPELTSKEKEYILVIKVILTTNVIFEDMDVFENAVQVLNNISPDVTKTEGVEPEWIWYALQLIEKLRPNAKFSNEVYNYIKYIFKNNGIKFLPHIPGYKDDPYLDKVIAQSKEKNIPETPLGIQAMKYLRILEYLKEQ
jgi:hypothetical protein